MLRLIYELQDQVARARSFAFIDRMEEISGAFEEHRPDVAVEKVLRGLQPAHYNTDLGASLAHFFNRSLDAVDGRTTVIFVGDGRNNFNDPRLDLVDGLRRRRPALPPREVSGGPRFALSARGDAPPRLFAKPKAVKPIGKERMRPRRGRVDFMRPPS